MEAGLSKSHSKVQDDSGVVENRRTRRRKARRSAGATPIVSGSSTPKRKSELMEKQFSNGVAVSATFEDGEDFIAFTFSDPSDDEQDQRDSIYVKGKGMAKDEASPTVGIRSSRDKDNGGTRDEVRRDKNSRHGRDRSPPQVREWDKGKRDRSPDGNGKRKHEMVFDFDDDYANKKQRLDASSRKAPWVSGIDWENCKNVAEMLHKEVEAFVKWISPSPVEDEIRGLIISQISKIVKSNFPDASVLPFGSYETKLYLPLGDIDLVILSDSMAYSDKVTVLHALANTLKRSGITSRVTIIAKAKVPIVKFITTHGRFNVDISVNQGNGLLSGQIVNNFLNNMHGTGTKDAGSMALRSLVMITKAFLTQRSMNEVYTGGLGSYSVVCLAVSFLQMHPKIRRGEIDPEENLGVLVMEFFELYGCYFNFDEVGISLRDGGTYFSKRQRGWFDYGKRGLLSIEDPADPSNDISRGSYGFHKVRTAFAGAHSILTSTAYLRAGILSSRRSGKSVHLRRQYEPEDLSIFSTVMGITQETLNHRNLVQELYDRRTLHNILGVRPAPTIVTVSKGTRMTEASSRANGASVHSVWHAGDDEDYDGVDDDPSSYNGHHNHIRDEDDEDGRYGIGRQPPRKRQKTGRKSDMHAIFVADDGDDDLDQGDDDYEYDEEPEDVRYLKDEAKSIRYRSRRSEDSDRRRSYWLSKGPGFGDVDTD